MKCHPFGFPGHENTTGINDGHTYTHIQTHNKPNKPNRPNNAWPQLHSQDGLGACSPQPAPTRGELHACLCSPSNTSVSGSRAGRDWINVHSSRHRQKKQSSAVLEQVSRPTIPSSKHTAASMLLSSSAGVLAVCQVSARGSLGSCLRHTSCYSSFAFSHNFLRRSFRLFTGAFGSVKLWDTGT